MVNRVGLFKLSLISLLCTIALACTCCNSQPRQSDDSENGNIVLSSGERLYQGFIISGDTWDVYIADLNDLKDPYKRYRVQFAQNEFIDARLINQLHKEGVKIDWPSKKSKGSVVWAQFIAEPAELFKVARGDSAVEINNELIIKKVILYSKDFTLENGRAWLLP